MQEINDFIIFLDSLYIDFQKSTKKLGYKCSENVELFYNYLKSEDEDFSEFLCDYHNCDEYKKLDLKDIFKKYAFSISYMLYYYDTNGNVEDDEISNAMRNYEISDEIFDNLYVDEGIGMEVIDSMDIFLNMTPIQKKVIALNLENDPFFKTVCSNNKMLAMLYYVHSNIKVSEEATIVYNVSQLVDNMYLENHYNEADYNDFSKIKKQLIIQSLTKDTKLNRKTPYIKHLFSVMLKNIYCDIHFSMINETRTLSMEDKKLYELINTNKVSFEELFNTFKDNDIFSNYIIKTFYDINIDKEDFELEAEKLVIKNDNLEEKIKKYYIE